MAGRVGWGGGPSDGPASLFPPLPQAEVLKEAEGEHRHQGVPVRPGPGPALEVVEAELLLELLVHLLARPLMARPFIWSRRDPRAPLTRAANPSSEVSAGRLARWYFLSPEARRSPTTPTSQTSSPGACCPLRRCSPSAGRTRRAANAATSGPLVPSRQLIRRQAAFASMASAATGSLRSAPGACEAAPWPPSATAARPWAGRRFGS